MVNMAVGMVQTFPDSDHSGEEDQEQNFRRGQHPFWSSTLPVKLSFSQQARH